MAEKSGAYTANRAKSHLRAILGAPPAGRSWVCLLDFDPQGLRQLGSFGLLAGSFLAHDLRVTRSIRLTEKFRLLLIGEGFNIFNVANLTGYSGTLDRVTRPAVAGGTATNPSFNFGQPTGRVNPVFGTGGPRALQFAARLAF